MTLHRILAAGSAGLALFTLTSCELFQKKQDPEPAAYDPYGTQPLNPYGQAPSPYGQPANPYGQAPNPYGQPANPYGGYEAGQAQPYQQPAPYVQNDPAPSYGGGGGGGTYTIQRGDTLTSIARRHNTTVQALKSANGLTSDIIQAGKTLRIP